MPAIQLSSIGRPFQFSIGILFGVLLTTACLITLVRHETGTLGGYGFFSPYCSAILATIYFWKYSIIRYRNSHSSKRIAFLLLLLLFLPFILTKCFIVPPAQMSTLGFWLGNPVWIFAVPMTSFFLIDFGRKFETGDEFFVRSVIEIGIVFPLWTSIWALSLIGLGWAENWDRNWMIGC